MIQVNEIRTPANNFSKNNFNVNVETSYKEIFFNEPSKYEKNIGAGKNFETYNTCCSHYANCNDDCKLQDKFQYTKRFF